MCLQVRVSTFPQIVSALAQCMAWRTVDPSDELWRVAAAAFVAVVQVRFLGYCGQLQDCGRWDCRVTASTSCVAVAEELCLGWRFMSELLHPLGNSPLHLSC